MDFKGTSALVTGAGRGLGAALAEGLAARGAKVVLVARDAKELDAVASRIRGRGAEAWSLPADLGSKDAIHPLAAMASALAGPIDVLVHCASTLGPVPMPLLLDTACEDLERVLAVNLLGPFRLTKALLGPMHLAGRGLVLSVSSDAAVTAYPRWGAYGVSKSALDQLSRAFAAEVPGVRFLSVDPGEMNTRMHAEAVPDADPASLADPAEVAEVLLRYLAGTSFTSGSRVELGQLRGAP
jgi:NAD(P)-dependent dehydrogenase (short-subunit alcohol dehydrogenase family)